MSGRLNREERAYLKFRFRGKGLIRESGLIEMGAYRAFTINAIFDAINLFKLSTEPKMRTNSFRISTK